MDNFCLFFIFASYFDVNIALSEIYHNEIVLDYFFASTETDLNETDFQRGYAVIVDPQVQSKSSTDHAAIQIVIFAGSTFFTILIVLLLCSICCKHRRRHDPFTRSPSLTSIQELIQERLLDRPPTYCESQNRLVDNPPTYNEVMSTTNLSSSVCTENIPTASIPSSIYNISSKISTSYANLDMNLSYPECESESPPSYHVSEGVVNPILLHAANFYPNGCHPHNPNETVNLSVQRELHF